MIFSKFVHMTIGALSISIWMSLPLSATFNNEKNGYRPRKSLAKLFEILRDRLQNEPNQDLFSGLKETDKKEAHELQRRDQTESETQRKWGALYARVSEYQRALDLQQRFLSKSLYCFLQAQEKIKDQYLDQQIAQMIQKMYDIRVQQGQLIDAFPDEQQLKAAAEAAWKEVDQISDEESEEEIIIPEAVGDVPLHESSREPIQEERQGAHPAEDVAMAYAVPAIDTLQAQHQEDDAVSLEDATQSDTAHSAEDSPVEESVADRPESINDRGKKLLVDGQSAPENSRQEQRSLDSPSGADEHMTAWHESKESGGAAVEEESQALPASVAGGKRVSAQKHPREGKSDKGDEEDAGLAPVQESKTPSKRARVANSAVL